MDYEADFSAWNKLEIRKDGIYFDNKRLVTEDDIDKLKNELAVANKQRQEAVTVLAQVLGKLDPTHLPRTEPG